MELQKFQTNYNGSRRMANPSPRDRLSCSYVKPDIPSKQLQTPAPSLSIRHDKFYRGLDNPSPGSSEAVFNRGERHAQNSQEASVYQAVRSSIRGGLQRTLQPETSNLGPKESFPQNCKPRPVVHGIQLVPTSFLPDRLRHVFSYKLFNAIQSKCFNDVFGSDDNFVMSAPTGSGKTVIFELAICRLLTRQHLVKPKVVYMAPTKSLCSERARDWKPRFEFTGLKCDEITGDTSSVEGASRLQSLDIIVTTPEKWDSITRKGKALDNTIIQVHLLLIDEIHTLGETRGPPLEVVVSRMKSLNCSLRIVALGATIPNISDIAQWLGRCGKDLDQPARLSTFGEDFRPVRLRKHVFALKEIGNSFQMDTACDKYLPGIIKQFSKGQPIMVFCFTKKSCQMTAKRLYEFRQSSREAVSWWPRPQFPIQLSSPELDHLLSEGIAFHHSGLKVAERTAIEKGFLDGRISMICCTSTLALGINLPCHLVIIKNTLTYSEEGPREYSDFEVMQMLGRAGRPQFQPSDAVAVIMTQSFKAERYERLVTGQETVESQLHLNLIEHLNAEISLGIIKSCAAVQEWLRGTFLSLRLSRNPAKYTLQMPSRPSPRSVDLTSLCARNVDALVQTGMASRTDDGVLEITPIGDAMARYYVRFSTVKTLLGLNKHAQMQEILLALCHAEEFRAIRLRQAEMKKYHDLGSAPGVRFPVTDVTNSAEKISVIICIELGDLRRPTDQGGHRIDGQYLQDRAVIFNNIHRLVRCFIDCQIHLKDAVAVKNGLELARSLSSRMWDDSPLQLRLIPGIGPVIARKLARAGITSIETLKETDPSKTGMLTGRKSEAEKFYHEAKIYPSPWIKIGKYTKKLEIGALPRVQFDIEVGFLNVRPPEQYNRKPIYVCIIAERSDHSLLGFKRLKASKNMEMMHVEATFDNPGQHIICHVVCEELIGTSRSATLETCIPADAFVEHGAERSRLKTTHSDKLRTAWSPNLLTKPDEDSSPKSDASLELGFESDDLGEMDLLALEQQAAPRHADSNNSVEQEISSPAASPVALDEVGALLRSDGKYQCKHKCRDKTLCRHLCCREGLEKAHRQPRVSRSKGTKPSATSASLDADPNLKRRYIHDKSLISDDQRQGSVKKRKRIHSKAHLA